MTFVTYALALLCVRVFAILRCRAYDDFLFVELFFTLTVLFLCSACPFLCALVSVRAVCNYGGLLLSHKNILVCVRSAPIQCFAYAPPPVITISRAGGVITYYHTILHRLYCV